MVNDVCLLHLAENIDMSASEVGGVSLPSQLESFTGDAVVSGWGALKSGIPSPDTLRAVTVPIVSDDGETISNTLLRCRRFNGLVEKVQH